MPTADGAFVVERAAGLAGLVPRQRLAARQGDLRLRGHRARRPHRMANGVLLSHDTTGGKTTWVWRESDPMAPYLATSTLGRFDLDDVERERHPVVRRGRSRRSRPATCCASCRRSSTSTRRSTGRTRSTPSARSSTTPRSSATRSRRRRSRTSTGCRTRRRSRTSCRTCGSATRSRSRVAGHLAARGVRNLVGVDLERGPGQQVRREVVQRALQHAGAGRPLLDTAARRSRDGRVPVQRDDLLPRRHDAGGAAREDRRLRLLPDHARLGAAEPLRQRDRRHSSSRSRRASAGSTSITSSTSGSTSPTSRPAGSDGGSGGWR